MATPPQAPMASKPEPAIATQKEATQSPTPVGRVNGAIAAGKAVGQAIGKAISNLTSKAPSASKQGPPAPIATYTPHPTAPFGTAPAGNFAHGQLQGILNRVEPGRYTGFNVGIGQRGPDAIGRGFIGELKPWSPSGQTSMRSVIGRNPQTRVVPYYYTREGLILRGP